MKKQLFSKHCVMKTWTRNGFFLQSKQPLESQVREVRIPVPWGYVAGKWWGPEDKQPIIAIHGWQDNSGTFDRIIPLLPSNLSVLALDLPGHGYSSWLPRGMYYSDLNVPILIRYIMKHFNWNSVSLMGHSLGAIQSFIYTMFLPKTVDLLVCFDLYKPVLWPNNAAHCGQGLDDFLKRDSQVFSGTKSRTYKWNELKKFVDERFCKWEYSHYILNRNTRKCEEWPERYHVVRDPRLNGWIRHNWSKDEVIENSKSINCPMFVTHSESTFKWFYLDKDHLEKVSSVLKVSSKEFILHTVEGIHHEHLHNPERIAPSLTNFLSKHFVEKAI